MTPPARVVFVYGDKPSGHSAVAAALRAELARLAPEVEAADISLASEVAPVVGPVISAAYLGLIQKTPQFWNYLYDNRAVAAALKEIREPLGALHRMRLRRRFKAQPPDLVVCTHALACAVLETEKAQGFLRAPLVAVLTDYGVHEYWVSPDVDLYLAPTEAVRAELIARAVAHARIQVTGIPVHPRFRKEISRPEARHKLRLSPEGPVALITGGSKGLGPITSAIDAVLGVPEAQALVVCGRNRQLLAALRRRHAENPRLRALGFTGLMPECFAASDVLVGKPGGVTATEAAACGVPLVIVDPLPGQEVKNCAYLTARGAAVEVRDISEMGPALQRLLRSPERLAAMGRAARGAASIDSATRAARALLKLLRRKML